MFIHAFVHHWQRWLVLFVGLWLWLRWHSRYRVIINPYSFIWHLSLSLTLLLFAGSFIRSFVRTFSAFLVFIVRLLMMMIAYAPTRSYSLHATHTHNHTHKHSFNHNIFSSTSSAKQITHSTGIRHTHTITQARHTNFNSQAKMNWNELVLQEKQYIEYRTANRIGLWETELLRFYIQQNKPRTKKNFMKTLKQWDEPFFVCLTSFVVVARRSHLHKTDPTDIKFKDTTAKLYV